MVQIDPHWRSGSTVTFLLTLSNKRTRQRFPGAFILAGLQVEAHSPGFKYDTLSGIFSRGGGFSDVEA